MPIQRLIYDSHNVELGIYANYDSALKTDQQSVNEPLRHFLVHCKNLNLPYGWINLMK